MIARSAIFQVMVLETTNLDQIAILLSIPITGVFRTMRILHVFQINCTTLSKNLISQQSANDRK